MHHHTRRLGKNSWGKKWSGWVQCSVFASDRPVSSPNFTVSFCNSWLRLGFESGTFLGMRNAEDTGQRRSLPSGSFQLSQGSQKNKTRIQILRRLHACVLSHSVMSLCDTMDCSLPGSPVLGILQAEILE